MQVKDNKEDAEQKAHEIYNMTPDALMILVELGGGAVNGAKK